MIDRYSPTWQAVEDYLLKTREEQIVKLIKSDSDKIRGKIELIDGLLGLVQEKTSPNVEEVNYFQD